MFEMSVSSRFTPHIWCISTVNLLHSYLSFEQTISLDQSFDSWKRSMLSRSMSQRLTQDSYVNLQETTHPLRQHIFSFPFGSVVSSVVFSSSIWRSRPVPPIVLGFFVEASSPLLETLNDGTGRYSRWNRKGYRLEMGMKTRRKGSRDSVIRDHSSIGDIWTASPFMPQWKINRLREWVPWSCPRPLQPYPFFDSFSFASSVFLFHIGARWEGESVQSCLSVLWLGLGFLFRSHAKAQAPEVINDGPIFRGGFLLNHRLVLKVLSSWISAFLLALIARRLTQHMHEGFLSYLGMRFKGKSWWKKWCMPRSRNPLSTCFLLVAGQCSIIILFSKTCHQGKKANTKEKEIESTFMLYSFISWLGFQRSWRNNKPRVKRSNACL